MTGRNWLKPGFSCLSYGRGGGLLTMWKGTDWAELTHVPKCHCILIYTQRKKTKPWLVFSLFPQINCLPQLCLSWFLFFYFLFININVEYSDGFKIRCFKHVTHISQLQVINRGLLVEYYPRALTYCYWPSGVGLVFELFIAPLQPSHP